MARSTTQLTFTQIDKAKPKEKEYLLSDGGGLHLRVRPNGSKNWFIKYTAPISKKRIKLSLGTYPHITLKVARDIANEYRELLAQGVDPKDYLAQKQREHEYELSNTFQAVYNQWHDRWSTQISVRTLKTETQRIVKHLLPKLKDIPVTKINVKLARKVLDPLYSEGKTQTVIKLVRHLNAVMNYAESADLVEINPLLRLSNLYPAKPSQNFKALPFTELPGFISALEASNAHVTLKNYIMFLLHTGVRGGVASIAKWQDFDFENRVWTIPEEDEKTSKALRVPLTDSVMKILGFMKLVTNSDKYVFSIGQQSTEHIASETARAVIIRMGYGKKTTIHGFRSLISTTLHECDQGFSFEAIEMVLSHRVGSSVSQIYNRGDYFEQRAPIMAWWSKQIERAIRPYLKAV